MKVSGEKANRGIRTKGKDDILTYYTEHFTLFYRHICLFIFLSIHFLYERNDLQGIRLLRYAVIRHFAISRCMYTEVVLLSLEAFRNQQQRNMIDN